MRRGCAELPNFGETISGVIMRLWQFTTFTTSRWLSAGASCRVLVVAWLTGLTPFMEYIRAQKADMSRLHGYFDINDDVKSLAVQMAIASLVPEGVQRELMPDPAVGKRLEHLEDTARSEMEFITHIAMEVWVLLAELLGWTGSKLMQHTIRSAHIALAFLHYRIFSHAKSLPWSLCIGDILSNVRRLVSLPTKPSEQISGKIWEVLRRGIATMDEVVGAIQLLAQLPWATKMAEEQHSSTSVMSRLHPEYDPETVRVRSFILSFLKLMPSWTDEEKANRKLRERCAVLRKQNPNYLTGRPWLFASLSHQARGPIVKSLGSGANKRVHSVVMQKHGETWRSLTAAQRTYWEAEAKKERDRRWQKLQDDLDVNEEQLAIAMARQSGKMRSGVDSGDRTAPPMDYTACKLQEDELAVLADLIARPEFKGAALEELRRRTSQTPMPLTEERCDELKGCCLNDAPSPPAKPAWLGMIVNNRRAFGGCLLARPFDNGELDCHMFVVGIQSPYHAMFTPLRELPQELSKGLPPTDWFQTLDTHWPFLFEADWSVCRSWSDLGIDEAQPLLVLPGLQYLGGDVLGSVSGPIPWLLFVECMKTKEEPKETYPGDARSSNSSSSASFEDPARKPRWILSLEREERRLRDRASVTAQDEGFDEVSPTCRAFSQSFEPDVPDEYIDRMCDVLEQKRLEWGLDTQPDTAFQVRLLGGEWLFKQKGVWYDAFQGFCQEGSHAALWCDQYRIGHTARFDIGLYGERGSYMMAKAWASKVQYWYDIFLECGEAMYVYSLDEVLGWEKPEEMVAYEQGPYMAKRDVKARLRWFDNLMPRL